MLFLLLIDHLAAVYGTPAATHVLVTHVGPCAESPRTILTLKELSVITQAYGTKLSGQFNISEDVENGWKIMGTMEKCQDIRNTDTCDHMSSYMMVHAGCTEDDESEDIYGLLFQYTKPMIECPVRAGSYKLDNYPFFTEDNYLTVYEAKISTSLFGYRFILEGRTVDKKNFLCVEANLLLLYMRTKDWMSNKSKQPQITTPTVEEYEEE